MDYLDFFSLFDDYIYFKFDNDDIFTVKKIAFKNKFEASFICLKKEKNNVIKAFEEMYSNITFKVSTHCLFALRAREIENFESIYIAFYLVKEI